MLEGYNEGIEGKYRAQIRHRGTHTVKQDAHTTRILKRGPRIYFARPRISHMASPPHSHL